MRSRRPGASLAGDVEAGRLVRVLAVAHDGFQPAAEGAPGRVLDLQRLGEPLRDRRVVGRGAGEGLRGELLAELQRQAAGVELKRVEHGRIVLRIGDDRHIGVVLRRGAHHGRAADVDVLDHRRIVGAGAAHLLERVEVDDDEVDRLDAVARASPPHAPGRRGSPSRPPCTAGCSVLTRPSMISGKPVSSETSRTAMPASAIAFAVPPVETSSMPKPASARAKSIRPVLSETDSSARRT